MPSCSTATAYAYHARREHGHIACVQFLVEKTKHRRFVHLAHSLNPTFTGNPAPFTVTATIALTHPYPHYIFLVPGSPRAADPSRTFERFKANLPSNLISSPLRSTSSYFTPYLLSTSVANIDQHKITPRPQPSPSNPRNLNFRY